MQVDYAHVHNPQTRVCFLRLLAAHTQQDRQPSTFMCNLSTSSTVYHRKPDHVINLVTTIRNQGMCSCAPLSRVCGVSREVPLVTRKKQDDKKASDWTHQRIWKDTSQTAYIAGLYLDNDRVLFSYGSSDIDSRMLSMSVAGVEGMFDGPFDCSQSEVLDSGSGQPMPPLGGSSSTATAAVVGTAVRQQQQVQSQAAAVNAALLRDVVQTAGLGAVVVGAGLPSNGSAALQQAGKGHRHLH